MNTLFVGQHLTRIDEVDSTNSYTFKVLRAVGLPEGAVIVANQQTSGRGQRGRVWATQPFLNLTTSMVLKPSFLEAEEYFYLTKVTTLALIHILKKRQVENVKVKWPNDIYVGEHKIAGILIENQLKGNRIGTSVVGIGLNINQVSFPSFLPKATSMKLVTGQHENVSMILEELCEHIEANYLRIKSQLQDLDRNFEQHLFGLNEWRTYLVNGEECELLINGVSSHGRLMVTTRSGSMEKYDFSQLQFVF